MVIPAATDYDWPVRKKRPEYIFLVKLSSTGLLRVFGFRAFCPWSPGMPFTEILTHHLGLAISMVSKTGTRRNQATNDNVFFQTT